MAKEDPIKLSYDVLDRWLMIKAKGQPDILLVPTMLLVFKLNNLHCRKKLDSL